MIETIEFENYKKKSDIYGTVMYPAVMVGPVQKILLQNVLNNRSNAKIIDPFHGSGTALYEAFEINSYYNLFGIDINPLANIITKAKLQGVDTNILDDINLVKEILIKSSVKFPTVNFVNINKWFRSDIINDLSKIKFAIEQIKSYKNRLFFWVMFSNIVRKYSNTRSSTYKLHIKKKEQIEHMKNNSIMDFCSLIERNYRFYTKSSNSFKLFKGDTLSLLKNFDKNYFDILITSPPYGDNATTVTYGQFSIIVLYWINKNDLELQGWEFDSFSKIDRESLGGYSKGNGTAKYFSYISTLLELIKDDQKKKKVQNFFYDYFSFLDIATYVTKEYIILTLGNRTVNGVNIELVDFTKKYLTDCGWLLTYEGRRNIYSKRTPKIISKNKDGVVYSMNQEFVVIFKKS